MGGPTVPGGDHGPQDTNESQSRVQSQGGLGSDPESADDGATGGASWRASDPDHAQWKKQLLAGAATAFATGAQGDTGQAALVTELFERIGRLDMELEWLKKKLAGLG
jgi:hypothetical protein